MEARLTHVRLGRGQGQCHMAWRELTIAPNICNFHLNTPWSPWNYFPDFVTSPIGADTTTNQLEAETQSHMQSVRH